MRVQLTHVQWGRVFLTGVLAAILLVVLNAIVGFLIFLVWGQLDHGRIASQVVLWSSYLLAFLVTMAAGVGIARKIGELPVHASAPLHGLLVGVVLALASLLLNLVFSGSFGSFVLEVLVDGVLFVAAGWLGGVLGSRVRGRG